MDTVRQFWCRIKDFRRETCKLRLWIVFQTGFDMLTYFANATRTLRRKNSSLFYRSMVFFVSITKVINRIGIYSLLPCYGVINGSKLSYCKITEQISNYNPVGSNNGFPVQIYKGSHLFNKRTVTLTPRYLQLRGSVSNPRKVRC